METILYNNKNLDEIETSSKQRSRKNILPTSLISFWINDLFRGYTFSPPSIPPSSFLLPVTAAKTIFAMANTLLSFVS